MKINVKFILGIILGLSLGSVGVFAANIASRDVSYENKVSNVNNVQEAIEELYILSQNKTFLLENGFRYTGENPNNYVFFNNELWRIIGFLDNKIKIIRSDSIGRYAWNTILSNDWETSSLYHYLNTTYYNSLESVSKNMVENATWRTGAWGNNDITSSQIYDQEGITKATGSNTLTATGYIGLMNISDYGYASSRCYATNSLNTYHEFQCASTNWLYAGIEEKTLTASSQQEIYSFVIYANGYVSSGNGDSNNVATPYEVRPALYLKTAVKIKSGSGTKKDPYLLEM